MMLKFTQCLSEGYKVTWSKPRTTCTDSLDLINAFGIGTNWTVAFYDTAASKRAGQLTKKCQLIVIIIIIVMAITIIIIIIVIVIVIIIIIIIIKSDKPKGFPWETKSRQDLRLPSPF